MKFARVIHGELPFTLNLPDGDYAVPLGGAGYAINLRNGYIAAALGRGCLDVGSPRDVQERLGDRFNTTYMWELRTIVSHREEVDVDRADFVGPTEQDFRDNMRFHVLDEFPQFLTQPDKIEDEITRQLSALPAEARPQFDEDTSIRLTWQRSYSDRATEHFCIAVNQLVRLYMATFNDFFVEEVLPQHFSNGLFGGLQVAGYFEGRYVNHIRDAGGRFPFIIQRPWFQHPAEQVDQFREQLGRGDIADPVALLGVRARAFFMRGVYRSAMAEASAALDLSLSRKIREGYRKKGKPDTEIDALLKTKIYFKDRAKDILKDAAGQGAHTFDNTLWTDVCKHKENRHGVAHAAAEPSRPDTEKAVEDMLRLAVLVNGIVPP